MAEKSCVVGLPVVPFNQSKVGDVCQYLQWLEDFFSKVFTTQVIMTILLLSLTSYFPLPEATAVHYQNIIERVQLNGTQITVELPHCGSSTVGSK